MDITAFRTKLFHPIDNWLMLIKGGKAHRSRF